MEKIAICIQARTNSKRLPNKAMMKIKGKPMVDICIDNALNAANYINRFGHRNGTDVSVYVVIPEGDPLGEYLDNRPDITVIEGPEDDLITRFNNVYEKFKPEYIVRLTGDCPLLPPYLISKAIYCATKNKYDFVDNAHPKLRTFFDGADVEVMSARAFEWLNEYAEEREHVCYDLRFKAPDWVKKGAIFSHLDLSFLKLSVDTQKDFDLVHNLYKSTRNKKHQWQDIHGHCSAHLF